MQLLLIAVVGQLIVHTIKQGGTQQSLVVLEGLALPDGEHILGGDLLLTNSELLIISALVQNAVI